MTILKIGGWTFTGQQEIAEGAEWLEKDAAYLYQVAAKYRSAGQLWVADKIEHNASHSASMAAQLIKSLT